MRQELENIPKEFKLKYLRRNLMCKLLLSFRQVLFFPVSIFSVDCGYTIKLLLTNWFGPYGKYLDLSFSCGPNIFAYGPHNWSIRA